MSNDHKDDEDSKVTQALKAASPSAPDDLAGTVEMAAKSRVKELAKGREEYGRDETEQMPATMQLPAVEPATRPSGSTPAHVDRTRNYHIPDAVIREQMKGSADDGDMQTLNIELVPLDYDDALNSTERAAFAEFRATIDPHGRIEVPAHLRQAGFRPGAKIQIVMTHTDD